jgi:ABC-type antimicrobial peptide transport system permease subunit
LFGQRNPLGEKLKLENGLEYVVTGMVDDVPAKSHLKFDFIGNWLQVEESLRNDSSLPQAAMLDNWLYLNSYTYLKLDNDANASEVLKQLSAEAVQIVNAQIAASYSLSQQVVGRIYLDFGIQPIRHIHMFSQEDHELGTIANADYIRIFSAIAFFILLITAINFMNLTTAKASRRYKEVAVRKYFGAGRRYLVYQFLTEAVVYSFIALFVALVLVELMLPAFNNVFGIEITSAGFIKEPATVWILVFTMLLGILSGSYPAMFFSGLKPHLALKGQMKVKKWGVVVRGLLVSSQVGLSLCLIVLSIGIYGQLRFLEDTPHGFSEDDTIVMEWGTSDREDLTKFKEALESSGLVKAIGWTENAPGDNPNVISFRQSGDSSQVVLLAVNYVDTAYFEAMEAEFIQGGVWEENSDSTASQSVVINASAASFLGYCENKQLTLELVGGRGATEIPVYKVVGIVKDIAFSGVSEAMRPMVFLQETSSNRAEHMLVRFDAGALEQGVEEVNRIWGREIPDRAIKFKYLSDIKDGFYSEERRFGKIALMFSGLGLIITIFGKIGLAAFVVQYYKKNIFIHSVLAAPYIRLLAHGLRGFWVFVVLGVVLALPISIVLLRFWLSGFSVAYSPGWFIYAIPVLILCFTSTLVAFLTGGREIKKGAHS